MHPEFLFQSKFHQEETSARQIFAKDERRQSFNLDLKRGCKSLRRILDKVSFSSISTRNQHKTNAILVDLNIN